MTVSVLIVGLGQIGMGYDLLLNKTGHVYSHARAFSMHEKFQLIAGVDPDVLKKKSFITNYNCPAYSDLETALSKHQPDLIIIAVPTQFHFDSFLCVLKYSNPKMILCEKPLSYNIDEAQKMVQDSADRKIKLYVNYMRRSDPGIIEIKKRIEKNEITSPYKVIVWYSKGLIHNGSHFFNLMEFLFGQMVSYKVLNNGRKWEDADPEPDLQVIYEDATVLFLAAWEESFSHYTFELLSPSGRLRYEQGGELIEWQSTDTDPYFNGYTSLSLEPEVIYSDMKRYQLNVAEHVSREFEGKESQLCVGKLALKTLENIHLILEK